MNQGTKIQKLLCLIIGFNQFFVLPIVDTCDQQIQSLDYEKLKSFFVSYPISGLLVFIDGCRNFIFYFWSLILGFVWNSSLYFKVFRKWLYYRTKIQNWDHFDFGDMKIRVAWILFPTKFKINVKYRSWKIKKYTIFIYLFIFGWGWVTFYYVIIGKTIYIYIIKKIIWLIK